MERQWKDRIKELLVEVDAQWEEKINPMPCGKIKFKERKEENFKYYA